jgi:hypothetical protein
MFFFKNAKLEFLFIVVLALISFKIFYPIFWG